MTGSRSLRRATTAALMLVAATAWLALAPTRLGGTTTYVTTSGNSMAPRFHTGDLAVLRPARSYAVGDVVAYRSALLGTVVLHRIVGFDGGRYVLKGDSNSFLDPERPPPDALIGRLSLRVPHGGRVLDALHIPAVAALLIAGAALLLATGPGHSSRRRARRRRTVPPSRRGEPSKMRPLPPAVRLSAPQVLTWSAVAALTFLVLGVVALGRPASEPVTVKTPYAERVAFSYAADAPADEVYPRGRLTTGDPVFLRLVDRVQVTARYRLQADAPHRVRGTMGVVARLSSPSGWSRDLPLAAPRPFTGDRADRRVTLDLPRLRRLIGRIETLTGAPAGAATLAVVARVKVSGTLAGRPLEGSFAPELPFQLDALALRPGDAAAAVPAKDALEPDRRGTVAGFGTRPSTLAIGGARLQVGTGRWIALGGLLLAVGGLVLGELLRRRGPADPAADAQARYRHLMVPIAGIAYDPAREPIDVTSMAALVQLAQRSERLILHHEADGAHTYLVDDEGTVYRHQVRPSRDARPPLAAAGPEAVCYDATRW